MCFLKRTLMFTNNKRGGLSLEKKLSKIVFHHGCYAKKNSAFIDNNILAFWPSK